MPEACFRTSEALFVADDAALLRALGRVGPGASSTNEENKSAKKTRRSAVGRRKKGGTGDGRLFEGRGIDCRSLVKSDGEALRLLRKGVAPIVCH